MLSKVVRILEKATNDSNEEPESEIEMSDSDPEDLELGSEEENHHELLWATRSPRHKSNAKVESIRPGDRAAMLALNSRIRKDLRAAKAAGFRVGHLGVLLNNSQDAFVTISCRVVKLGISEEALQAWNLDPSQYFVLLIHYTAGYRTLERLTADEISKSRDIEMRVGLCKHYKIHIRRAIEAFSQTGDKGLGKTHSEKESSRYFEGEGLSPVFIGRPLEELLNNRLVRLLMYRVDQGLSWAGAEAFYNDNQGRNLGPSNAVDSKYWAEEKSQLTKTLPNLVTADHLTKYSELSFPLLAMQFTLRHLVRCTEFCLVCHCKMETDFEALKPYVCSKPLCLYQYMSLGFGPSIEHEIVSQPNVVDLLISFCYSSAHHHRISNLPVGMGLDVPAPTPMLGGLGSMYGGLTETSYRTPIIAGSTLSIPPSSIKGMGSTLSTPPSSVKGMGPSSATKYSAKLDQTRRELILPHGADKNLRVGHWIFVLIPSIPEERLHYRVIDVVYPMVRLGIPVSARSATSQKREEAPPRRPNRAVPDSISWLRPDVQKVAPPPAVTPDATPNAVPYVIDVQFIIYDQKFDDLSDDEKQQSICILLNTLPSVKQMKEFLQSKNSQNASLRDWNDRISPAALGILRWIIASNRSCIVQVDNLEGDAGKSEERVSGMPDWMQFRFAQGAPDKEQRFVASVREKSNEKSHPTLFAWHGSPLQNWHGIVREGLHFKHTTHGRAFGHGVYHALDVGTSLGYSGGGFQQYSLGVSNGQPVIPFHTPAWEWQHSQLKITGAVALNEIVNAPEEFVCKSPHLVVAQLDWIQSRYLFVRCTVQARTISDYVPSQAYEQDPTWTPTGYTRQKIVIPITAVSKSRRPVSKIVKYGNKKAKIDLTAGSELDRPNYLSDSTNAEDTELLLSDNEKNSSPNSQYKSPKTSEAEFIPGGLDKTTLPLLAAPTYATSSATRSLQRELMSTLQIQSTHPAHELGWYIDPQLVENVYQWIVELHSFEAHLPLAKDMKVKGLKSVVLEIRFGQEYPISPPFVRVIRPRFLSFVAGGGGHVTAGGALCMELLTNSGWSAVSNIESVLLQVRLAISSMEPKPARLEPGSIRDYGVVEAVNAFIRACQSHGVSQIFTYSHPPLHI